MSERGAGSLGAEQAATHPAGPLGVGEVPEPSVRRPRRAVLAAGIGALSAAAAGVLTRVSPAQAAAGDPLRIGQSNSSGTSQTTLNSSALGASFTLRTTNGANGATGIFGWASHTGTNATRGVYGRADAAAGDGVQGVQNGPAGTGAAVRALGNSNHGVVGLSGAGSVTHLPSWLYVGGVRGVGGDGVVGVAPGPEVDSIGAGGIALGAGGIGVYGEASHESGENIGVLGVSFSPLGWAVLADGDAFVTNDLFVGGTVNSPASTLRLDHPTDPDAQYLHHASVSSSEHKTMYDGVVTTDASGDATVELPAWLEALNVDFRYQLTTIGSFARAIVSSKLADGHFSIKTDAPMVEVCWQITGVRRDAWAAAHPIAVESAKPDVKRPGIVTGASLDGTGRDRVLRRRG